MNLKDKILKKTRHQDYHNHINNNIIKVLLILIIMFISTTTVQGATSLKLNYNNKNVNYTGKKVTYKLDGKSINNSKHPGIIVDDISLVPAYDVFNNKLLGSSYKYTSKTKDILIKKDNTVIKMKVGSKIAYVNGVKVTAQLAPVLVKYKSTGKTKLLVPARFVSERLGYTYTWYSNTSSVTLKAPTTSSLTLFYNNQWNTYRGTQGNVTVDGKKINISNLPSFMINNIAMLQARRVFSNSSIGASYHFDRTSKQVTLKTDDTEIVLTLNSKTAKVNGAIKTMDEAPLLVKNKKNNTEYIMVPGRSIANYLGYNYIWDSKKSTSTITTKPVVLEPELGGEDISPMNPEKTYVIYNMIPNMVAEYNYINGIMNANIQGDSMTQANITSVTQDFYPYENKDVYTISSNAPFGNISSTNISPDTLLVDIENTSSYHTTYFMNDGLVKHIIANYDMTTNRTKLEVSLNTDHAKYEISLSDDKRTMYITVYKNYITKLEAVYKAYSDIISLSTLYMTNPVISDDPTHIYIDLPYSVNAIGQQSSTISDGYCIENIEVINPTIDSTRIIITKSSSSEYAVKNTGSNYTISIFDEAVSNYSVMIKKPIGINASNVTDVDMYYKNQFKITIPGNQLQFLQENPTQSMNSIITNISYALNSEGNTDVLIKTKKLQGYKLEFEDDYIKVIIDEPKKIYKKIVVLDAGHGGSDPGAMHKGYKEKDINYQILYSKAIEYFNSPNSDIKAYWTRQGDTFIGLYDRADYAKKIGADLFISLHMNAAAPVTAKGIEVYYSSNNKSSVSGLNSKNLATIFVSKLTQELNVNSRGAKDSKFVVCKSNTIPAILIELGFMTNTRDLNNMTDPTFQNNAAKSIYNATKYTFDQYPTGR